MFLGYWMLDDYFLRNNQFSLCKDFNRSQIRLCYYPAYQKRKKELSHNRCHFLLLCIQVKVGCSIFRKKLQVGFTPSFSLWYLTVIQFFEFQKIDVRKIFNRCSQDDIHSTFSAPIDALVIQIALATRVSRSNLTNLFLKIPAQQSLIRNIALEVNTNTFLKSRKGMKALY